MNLVAKQKVAALVLFSMTAIWGISFILMKWALVTIDVFYFMAVRFFIATAFMAIVFNKKMRGIDRGTFKAGIILGILLGLSLVLQTFGLKFTTASNSALITGLYMVLIPPFALIYPKIKTSWFSILGIMIAIPGSFLLTQYSFTGVNLGDILTGLVTIPAAWHIIFTGEFAKKHSLIPLMVIQFATVCVITGFISIFTNGANFHIEPIAWLAILQTALFCACLGFSLMTWGQRYIDPSRAGIIYSMEAVFGALFGWWLGGEMMTHIAFIGACMMVLGMIVSEIKPLTAGLFDKFWN